MKGEKIMLNENLKQELFRKYVIDYVLPLIGHTSDECKTFNFTWQVTNNNDDDLYLFHWNGRTGKCESNLKVDKKYNSYDKSLFKSLTLDFLDNINSFEINNKSDTLERLLFNHYLERGLCGSISGTNNPETINNFLKLFEILENWSVKTYEGHHVCYGFAINLDNDKDGQTNNEKDSSTFDFTKFLDDEYSAVLSDGITSLIELDTNINFKGYLSLTENETISACDLEKNSLPYRFAPIISKFINGNRIGLFLLQNGDMIIAKNGEILFIKRNNKWLNFSQKTFENNIQSETNGQLIENDKLKHIFKTTLDVSFTHCGGIIAVVDPTILTKAEILNRIDDLTNNKSSDVLFNEEFEEKSQKLHKNSSNTVESYEVLKREIRKRLTKRKVIKQLLGNNREFDKIDRKLRAELIGMDGACILDRSLNVISFGAIIQNDSGSSGGGRGAAARKLSTQGGFAIKISTDGYIEVYVNGKRIYSIK